MDLLDIFSYIISLFQGREGYMNRLWLILAIALAIARLTNWRDDRLRADGKEKMERFYTACLILVLGFFCGLRTWGNDTVTYMQVYDLSPTWDEFLARGDFDFSEGVGFVASVSIIKTLGLSMQDYLMIFAFATIIPYVLFVRRYSVNAMFGVFLMFATGMYTFTLAAIKQTMATGICLAGLPMLLDGKKIRYCLMVALASLFHPYALIYLVAPFLMFQPWKGKTVLMSVIFVGAGFMLDTLIGTVLDITTAMGAEYTQAEMMGAGVNIFRVMISFVPVGFAVFYGSALFERADKKVWLMFNLAMLNALIMFVGLFGTANYFARMANYFLPAQVVVLPWILYSAHPTDRRWMLPATIIGYTGYFYYENAIIRPFDTGYSHMSFWEYVLDLLQRILT
jgi:hypothetical protein